MFDIGWVEMMVVIVVLIIVIGPRDLPMVLHTMGRWVARARAMARSFQDSIEDMARESGLDEMRDEVRSIRDFRLDEEVEKTIDPEGELKEGLAPSLEDGGKRGKGKADPDAPEKADTPASGRDAGPDGEGSAADEPREEPKAGVETEGDRTADAGRRSKSKSKAGAAGDEP